MQKQKKRRTYVLLIISLVVLSLIVVVTVKVYRSTFSFIKIKDQAKSADLYIPTGTKLSELLSILYQNGTVSDTVGLKWIAKKKNLPQHLNPGHYVLTPNMRTIDLVNLIRSGEQTPVKVTFGSLRTLEELAKKVSKQIETDAPALTALFHDTAYLNKSSWTLQTLPALFIPNTYEFYWNTSAERFFERMEMEYSRFWSPVRLQSAKNIRLTPVEVSTLASIVEDETYRDSEMPLIAGVYLNRLKKGYRLQADPTIRYARGDFSGKRVLSKDLKINSPYNTYRHYGLPPGPIRIPSIQAIDAVLHAKRNGYLYFCAKEDFSGYHNFAKTLKEHNRNAAKYRRALDRRKIYR